MAAYDVSRATVRKAIESLIADGLLHRIHGKRHVRRDPAAGEPAAPRVVQPGHAPSRADPVDPAAQIELDRPAADVAEALISAPTARLAAGPGPPRRRPADRAGERLVPAGAPPRPRPARPQRLAVRAVRRRLRPHDRQRRADAVGRDGGREHRAPPRRPVNTPLLVFRRVRAPRTVLWSTSSPATGATATRSTCPWAVTGSVPVQHPAASHLRREAAGAQQKRPRAPPPAQVQPRPHRSSAGASCSRSPRPGRSPPAATRPAGPARRRWPRLPSPPSSAPPQRDLREPGAAVRGRCRDRHGQEGRRVDRARRRRRLPGSRGSTRCRRSSWAPGDEPQELINYGVLGGIVIGLTAAYLWQRYHRIRCRRTSRSSAAGGSCRSSPPSPRSRSPC